MRPVAYRSPEALAFVHAFRRHPTAHYPASTCDDLFALGKSRAFLKSAFSAHQAEHLDAHLLKRHTPPRRGGL